MKNLNTFVIDFEFNCQPGLPPKVWCIVYHCLETGETVKTWLYGKKVVSPFPREFIMVAHYAMAELACFHALGWTLPTHVIDTLAEARVVRGQCAPPNNSWGLLSLATAYNIPTMASSYKETMRDLAMGDAVPIMDQGPLLDYCNEDVEATTKLWGNLRPLVSIEHAKFRGRYLKNLSKVEGWGIPVDRTLLSQLEESKSAIVDKVWESVRVQYKGVVDSTGSFSSKAWNNWCRFHEIPWPMHASGSPKLDAETFKKMSDRYSSVRTMAYARKLRGKNRLPSFPVGEDSRIRAMLSPFGSDTGRNQPSTTKFVFGASAWVRSIISAHTGSVLAYIDFSAEEPAIGAYLSGDTDMLADYKSGDPYLAFAKRAGAVPEEATKSSHNEERNRYKVVALAVQYGMREHSLASNLGIAVSAARRLIKNHQGSYPVYWKWRESMIDHAKCGGTISTRFGWRRKAKKNDAETSIANFIVQASGAEILQIAIIALVEAGHKVIAPVHDAVLVELQEDGWEDELQCVRNLMQRAVDAVAPGLHIPTDVELVAPGTNYIDKRGKEFWDLISPIIGGHPVESDLKVV